jgi:tRNA threonylcarbamoyladenosine dehydratase
MSAISSVSVVDRDRFGGIERLYGVGCLERLQQARATIIGVGGVGSWTVEALARTGVGKFRLIDLDDICVTNTNRQLPALTGTVGRSKVEVLAERVRLINPQAEIEAITEFFLPSSSERLSAAHTDVVIDAVDRMSIKALIIASYQSRGVPVVTVGSAGGKKDPTMIRRADLGRAGSDELLRQVRKRLRREHGYAGGEGVHFGVPAIFSAEPVIYPQADGQCSYERPPGDTSLRMDCASGYGAACAVTGAFGFAAAAAAVDLFLSKSAEA